MGKISNKDFNIKKDWIVVHIDHERYTFDCDIYYYSNSTLKEISSKLCPFGKVIYGLSIKICLLNIYDHGAWLI